MSKSSLRWFGSRGGRTRESIPPPKWRTLDEGVLCGSDLGLTVIRPLAGRKELEIVLEPDLVLLKADKEHNIDRNGDEDDDWIHGEESHRDQTSGAIGHDESDDEGPAGNGFGCRFEADFACNPSERLGPIGGHEHLGAKDDDGHEP